MVVQCTLDFCYVLNDFNHCTVKTYFHFLCVPFILFLKRLMNIIHLELYVVPFRPITIVRHEMTNKKDRNNINLKRDKCTNFSTWFIKIWIVKRIHSKNNSFKTFDWQWFSYHVLCNFQQSVKYNRQVISIEFILMCV
jgi:hypothetical protein